MNDPEIRARLYPLLLGGVVIDELPTGTTRADVVHITDAFMHGYEVKGDGDTLQRVENQLRCYAEVYDFVTFVVTEKHLAKLLPLLPEQLPIGYWQALQARFAAGGQTALVGMPMGGMRNGYINAAVGFAPTIDFTTSPPW